MSTDQVMENEEFQKYWLTHANTNAVFEWLRAQKPRFGVWSGKSEEIETVLIERHEPLINLGLALYATDLSDETSLSLFRNNDRTIKKAALSGDISGFLHSWVERHGILDEILDSFDAELLKYLLSNESIPDDLLVSLYKREKLFNSLTDEQWLTAIAFTTSNPRISTLLDELPWDGFEYFRYCEVFTAGWKLFETLPVNEKSAAVLSHLGENLVPDKSNDMDVFATIKRWKVEGNDESDGLINSYVKCRYVLAKLIGCGAWAVKDRFREAIGTEFESLKDSDDLALRLSYYRRFRAHEPEEVRKLFEKDNDKFLNVALYNTNLYVNEAIRDELNKCCQDYEDPYHASSHLESFDAQVKRLTKEHPEWFPDFEGEITFDEVEDPLLRTNKRLEHLQQQTKILSQKLIGSESENQPTLIDDMKTEIDNVKSDLSESNQQLSEQLSKVIFWGGWMGVVIILLLLSLIFG